MTTWKKGFGVLVTIEVLVTGKKAGELGCTTMREAESEQ